MLHPFLGLFGAALGFGVLSGMPFEQIIESINGGFGGTLSSIGIIIIARLHNLRRHHRIYRTHIHRLPLHRPGNIRRLRAQ